MNPINSKNPIYGLNIDPTNPQSQTDPTELQMLGVTVVRFTFKDTAQSGLPIAEQFSFYEQWCQALAQVGIDLVVLLSDETYPLQLDRAWTNYVTGFVKKTVEIAKALAPWQPTLQIWQAPDHPTTGLSPEDYGQLLKQSYQAIKAVAPQTTVISGGLVSGQPDWWQQVMQSTVGDIDTPVEALTDALAVHPYPKRPQPDWPHTEWGTGFVGDLITAYQQVTSLPIWLTEVGVNTLNDDEQADYLRRFYQTIASDFAGQVQRVCWFCYADGMTPGFGLVDYAGRPKAAYTAYQDMAGDQLNIAATPQISVDRLHLFAAYLEQHLVFGARDRNLQQLLETELIGNSQTLSRADMQQLIQRMLANSSHTVSTAELDALLVLQNEQDLFRALRSVVLVVHQRTGALTGRIGVHTRISAESEFNALTNIAAVMQLLSHIQSGNRLIVLDMVKATADENKLYAPDIFETEVYGQHRNGLIENHAWNLQKLVRAIRDQGYQDQVILMIRLDGPDSGANVNPFSTDSRQKYRLAIAKFIRYLETVLPDTPFKLVLGNEPDLFYERQWSDPQLNPRIFTLNQFAPATGAFMKQIARQRPDITFLCPALSADLKYDQLSYYTAFFGEDRPNNLIPTIHGYAGDVVSLPATQKNLIEQQAEILRLEGKFSFVSGTEIGSSNPFGDIESLSEKGYFDNVVVWLLLSSNHQTTPGQDNNWSFKLDPERDDPVAHTLGNAVNRSKARVIRNIYNHDGDNLQIVQKYAAPSPFYAVQYLSHTTPATLQPNQMQPVQILVRNTSNKVWVSAGPNRFRLGYHWYTRTGEAVNASLWADNRTALPGNILPGDSVTLVGQLAAPNITGDFEVRWDMVEEQVTWFAWKGIDTLNVPITVQQAGPPPPSGITVRASHNNVISGADNLLQAIDGIISTRWSSRAVQQPGMWFEIDLNEARLVSGVALDILISPNDYPRGYLIRVSTDRQQWGQVARNDDNGGAVDVNFSPRIAQYIRIEQTGSASNFWWSIHDIEVRSAVVEPSLSVSTSHNNVNSGVDNLLQAIDGKGATRWSSRAVQQPGMWFEIDLNETKSISGLGLDTAGSANDYPRGYVIRVSTDRQQWVQVARNDNNDRAVDVVFSSRLARYIKVEQTGSASNFWWSIHGVRIHTEVVEPSLSVSASHNNVNSGADNLHQAIDSNLATRWSSRALQQPGMWFEVDLNETKSVSGLVLDMAGSANDYPRGYIIRVSTDRQQWLEVARNDNNGGAVDVNFSPRTARYIRIEQIGSASNFWWSIHRVGIK